ncbi:MAG: DUF4114 domain-containing protein [Candidatus Andersenbacteria bacterium]|nr:DUF4114 domain-containing protein [Candidatus Andersenbacteria bacterium]
MELLEQRCLLAGSGEDVILYVDSPDSFPSVTARLQQEFGATPVPPVVESTTSYYRVPGDGFVDATFRFRADTGSFRFSFGYYRVNAALLAVDLSTDDGRVTYATQALAPGNAFVIFDDFIDNPGLTRTILLQGGDTIGFFLIPDAPLQIFQIDQCAFEVNGVGSRTLEYPGRYRWPFFGRAAANPAGLDQLMTFEGIAAASGNPSHLLAWEDLTRAAIFGNQLPSDENFNDLVVAIEGLQVATSPPPVVGDTLTIITHGFQDQIRPGDPPFPPWVYDMANAINSSRLANVCSPTEVANARMDYDGPYQIPPDSCPHFLLFDWRSLSGLVSPGTADEHEVAGKLAVFVRSRLLNSDGLPVDTIKQLVVFDSLEEIQEPDGRSASREGLEREVFEDIVRLAQIKSKLKSLTEAGRGEDDVEVRHLRKSAQVIEVELQKLVELQRGSEKTDNPTRP